MVQASLSLPKCLDNILRLQITAADEETDLGEVSIVTEPKILPLPPSTFDTADDEGEASWLEGRFQR